MSELQTILIVDDEPANFRILSSVLKGKFRVLVAKSGEQAFKVLESNVVDLILLDIVMPELDGYEILRRLKNAEATKNLPVIFITSKDEDRYEARGLQLGAVDYIRKPFYLPIVEARVNTHLDLKRKTEILTELVSLDGLTNIPNRRKFDEQFLVEWKRGQRADSPLTLFIIDVDHFKPFNDNYGHAAGDTCLRNVAANLKKCVRRPGDFLARYGGEEFTMILPNVNSVGAYGMAELVREMVEELAIPHAYSVSGCVTVSVGGATAIPHRNCEAPGLLLETADKMLYLAKESGRNTFKIHEF